MVIDKAKNINKNPVASAAHFVLYPIISQIPKTVSATVSK